MITAEAYYNAVFRKLPQMFDKLGAAMGAAPDGTGYCFLQALIDLLEKTDMRSLAMSGFGMFQVANMGEVYPEDCGSFLEALGVCLKAQSGK